MNRDYRYTNDDNHLSDHLINIPKQNSEEYFSTSELSYEEEDEEDNVSMELKQHQDHVHALAVLDDAQNKGIAFAIKTNVQYISSQEDDPPVPNYAVSFQARDFIHIKEKYNNDWWIGRLVREGCQVGFVPSPSKMESIIARNQQYQQNQQNVPNLMYNNINNNNFPNNFNNNLNNKSFNNSTPPLFSPGLLRNDIETGSQMAGNAMGKGGKKKGFFKKPSTLVPYEVVPAMRPIIFIGPSLKGYEVTDMMQRALFDFLKNRFDKRVVMARVATDISLAKRSNLSSSSTPVSDKKTNTDKNKPGGADQAQMEIERIFELARNLNLLVLDCDCINHPSQLHKSPLAPILVFVKVSSLKVLQKLIKTRGKFQSRNLNVQLAAAERLYQCSQDCFDVILDENTLDEACEHLSEYLEAYWNAAHYKDGPTRYQQGCATLCPPQPINFNSNNIMTNSLPTPWSQHPRNSQQPRLLQHLSDIQQQLQRQQQQQLYTQPAQLSQHPFFKKKSFSSTNLFNKLVSDNYQNYKLQQQQSQQQKNSMKQSSQKFLQLPPPQKPNYLQSQNENSFNKIPSIEEIQKNILLLQQQIQKNQRQQQNNQIRSSTLPQKQSLTPQPTHSQLSQFPLKELPPSFSAWNQQSQQELVFLNPSSSYLKPLNKNFSTAQANCSSAQNLINFTNPQVHPSSIITSSASSYPLASATPEDMFLQYKNYLQPSFGMNLASLNPSPHPSCHNEDANVARIDRSLNKMNLKIETQLNEDDEDEEEVFSSPIKDIRQFSLAVEDDKLPSPHTMYSDWLMRGDPVDPTLRHDASLEESQLYGDLRMKQVYKDTQDSFRMHPSSGNFGNLSTNQN